MIDMLRELLLGMRALTSPVHMQLQAQEEEEAAIKLQRVTRGHQARHHQEIERSTSKLEPRHDGVKEIHGSKESLEEQSLPSPR